MNVYTRTVGNNYQVVGLEHAQILSGGWRNFSAEQRQYDSGQTRHFAVLVEEQNVQPLEQFGFNVGFYQPKDTGRDGYHYLDINLGWKLRDPKISIVSSGTTVKQTEETIGDLDRLNNIDYADIEVSPYHWNNNGRSGVKPWVSEMFVYLEQPSPIYNNWRSRTEDVQEPVQMALFPDEDDIPF